jgi:hypothetical protein
MNRTKRSIPTEQRNVLVNRQEMLEAFDAQQARYIADNLLHDAPVPVTDDELRTLVNVEFAKYDARLWACKTDEDHERLRADYLLLTAVTSDTFLNKSTEVAE